MIELKCDNCQKVFKRKTAAIEKSKKRNQHFYYCSKSCSDQGKGNKELYKWADNKKDELSPYRWYIRVSKYRDKEMDLSPEYLKSLFESQNRKCVYSNVDLNLWDYKKKGGNDKIYTASLDRIDSSKGYIVGNVQFVSMAVNLFKHTMSHEDTLNFCRIIAKNYQDKDIVQTTVDSWATCQAGSPAPAVRG